MPDGLTLPEIQKRISDIMEQKVKPQLGTQYTAPEFEEEFRRGLGVEERLRPIIEREAGLRTELYGVLPEVMGRIPGQVAPAETLGLIEKREAPFRERLETTARLREYKYGRIEDTINKMTQGYTAKLQKAKDEYDKQQDELRNLMDLRKEIEDKRRWEEEMKYRWAGLEEVAEPTGYESLGLQYLRDELTDEEIDERFIPTAATEIRRNKELIQTAILQQRETTGREWTDEEIREELRRTAESEPDRTYEQVKQDIMWYPEIKNVNRALLILDENKGLFGRGIGGWLREAVIPRLPFVK